MSVKAKLKVVLQADDTVVAESEDALLWQRVLTAINTGATANAQAGLFDTPPNSVTNTLPESNQQLDGIAKLATQIGVAREVLEGACCPTQDEPYLQLDIHCWEAMKSQTPERGPNAYSPTAVVSTLLTLWFRAAGLGTATQAHAQAVLAAINIRDQNASRGIQRSTWLQARSGGAVVLNPAQVSRAVAIAKAFCEKQWPSDIRSV